MKPGLLPTLPYRMFTREELLAHSNLSVREALERAALLAVDMDFWPDKPVAAAIRALAKEYE